MSGTAATVAAIISAVAAAAGTSVGIATSVQAQKEAERMRKKQEQGLAKQKIASEVVRMKSEDFAGLGGLSAGEYGRGLMQNDVYAQQVQGLTNKIESQSVFGDAFRKEAFAKLALSDIKQFTQKTSQNLQDMDSAAIVRNAEMAVKSAATLANIEAGIFETERAIEAAEIEQKRVMMENVSKGIATTAALVGATVKYAGMQDTGAKGTAPLSTPVANNGFAQAATNADTGVYNYKTGLYKSPFNPVAQSEIDEMTSGVESVSLSPYDLF